MKSAGTLGVVLIVVGIFAAFLYSTGRWAQIWAITTGTTPAASAATGSGTPAGTTTPPIQAPQAGQGSFGSWDTPASKVTLPPSVLASVNANAAATSQYGQLLVALHEPSIAYPQLAFSLN